MSEAKQDTLTDPNPFVAETSAESLEILADAVRPLNNRVELTIGPDTISCAGSNVGNWIGVEYERPADAPHQETVTVESSSLVTAIDNVAWADDRVALEITTTDDGDDRLEIYTCADEDRFWHEWTSIIGDVEPGTIGQLFDHEFGAIAELPAWKLAGAMRTIAAPADSEVFLMARDGGLSFKGNEITFRAETRHTEWPFTEHVAADVDLDTAVDAVDVTVGDTALEDVASMLPLTSDSGEILQATVYLDDDYPTLLESEAGVDVAIAPRNRDDDDEDGGSDE